MRGRAALVAIVTLVLVSVVCAVLIVRMTTRSIDATVSAQAAEAPEIARLYIAKFGNLAAAAPTIVKHITRPGLRVLIRANKTGVVYSENGHDFHFRRGGGPGGGGPGGGGPGGGGPGFPGPIGGPHGPTRAALMVFALAGQDAKHVAIPDGEVVIFPRTEAIVNVVRTVGAGLAVVFTLSIMGLWLYARGVRREAMRPLRETTLSLQRLASRDFSPRTIVTGEGSAYDELARAYNAAVEAVSSAFAERRTAEIEMQRFIADAGHELRTPLTIVMGYLDIIDGGALTDPRIADRVISGMRTESVRMRRLIDKLIVLARMDTPSDVEQRGNIDVVALVARVVESLEPLATQAIDVTGVPFAHVFANEDDIAEALTNVIENALKYAPHSDVRVTIERSVEQVTIAITDRGPGMSTEEARNAFERFYRGERRGEIQGSGLGLAIAKRAVERARGTITLHTVSGAGTTFTIALPEAPILLGDRPHFAHR